MLKSYRWVGGCPCDFSVSPSPFGLNFGTLDFGTSDLGLTIMLDDHKYIFSAVVVYTKVLQQNTTTKQGL